MSLVPMKFILRLTNEGQNAKLNQPCVLGTLQSGNGNMQLEHLMSPMDVKSITSKTYQSIERRVGQQIEKVERTSCSNWLDQEVKSTDLNNNLAISYAMGWQKRGNAGNSRTGQATAAGRARGKIVDFETRNKTCRICECVQVRKAARYSRLSKESYWHFQVNGGRGCSRNLRACESMLYPLLYLYRRRRQHHHRLSQTSCG